MSTDTCCHEQGEQNSEQKPINEEYTFVIKQTFYLQKFDAPKVTLGIHF